MRKLKTVKNPLNIKLQLKNGANYSKLQQKITSNYSKLHQITSNYNTKSSKHQITAQKWIKMDMAMEMD